MKLFSDATGSAVRNQEAVSGRHTLLTFSKPTTLEGSGPPPRVSITGQEESPEAPPAAPPPQLFSARLLEI